MLKLMKISYCFIYIDLKEDIDEKHEEAALDSFHPILKECESFDGNKEDRDVGNVSYTTYWRLLRSGASIPLILVAAIVFVLTEGKGDSCFSHGVCSD